MFGVSSVGGLAGSATGTPADPNIEVPKATFSIEPYAPTVAAALLAETPKTVLSLEPYAPTATVCDADFASVTALASLSQAAGSYLDTGPSNIGVSNDSGVTTEAVVTLFGEQTADVDNTDAGMIIVGDPDWDSVVLLTHMDHGTPVDVSGVGRVLTVNSATRDTTDKKFGASSFSFGTSSENITAPDSTDWDIGPADYTVECWVWFDSAPAGGSDPVFVSHWDSTSDRGWMFWIFDGDLVWSYTTTGSDQSHIGSAWTPSGTTWYHIASVRTGGEIINFIDGVEHHRETNSATYHTSAATLAIGHPDTATVTQFQRNVDDVRITKGVARYTGTFTPPTRPHSSAQVIPTSGLFTMEGHVRWEDDPGTAASIICGQWNEGEDERGWQVYLNNNQLRFSYSTDGAVGTVVNTDKVFNPAADTWYHWAITRDGSNDMRWFIDGTQIGTTANITATFHDSSAIVALGETEDHVTGSTQIYLANHRFTSGVARYTANFTAPAAPFLEC